MREHSWKLAVILIILLASFFTPRAQATAPTITSLSPTSGAVGATVVITGTNFGSPQGTSTVKFNGTTATANPWTATSITVTVPTGATTGNVVVTVGGTASNGKSFTVLPTPTITSLSVTSGAVGATVVITGTNFGSTQGTGTVKFNGTTATVNPWTATSITVTVPSGATTGNVVVNASGVNTNGKSFTVLPTPTITSLSVTSGAVGATVVITGTNFGSTQGTGTVKFNGTTATANPWTATSITVTVPTGATTGNVVVNTSGVNTNGSSFTVLPTPTITSLSVTSGAVGATVVITGTNFGSTQGTGTVKFNGTTATVNPWTATSITVTVPSGATTGNVVVNASGVNTSGSTFTVLPTPTITSLSVTSGAVGATVVVTGTNFGSTQGTGTVKFNGTTATVNPWTATSITVTVPSGATTGNVVVHASGVDTNGSSFTVLPTPSITTVSPTTGAVGAEVAMAGANFGAIQGNGSVSFNGTVGTPTSWSADSIAVPVPSGATTGNVVVNASGVASNGLTFTIVPAPSVSNLSVTTGVVGTPVTITGTNFGATQGRGMVSFNDTAATPTSWSATSIGVTVPSGATTGNVVVTASGVASNGLGFTVTEALTITGLSPTSGVVGDEVIISGTGFGLTQGGSTITLNSTNVAVAGWNDTSIVAIVPVGASSGQFSVTVGGHAVNSATFTVTTLPAGWSQGDIGSVGVAGSASFANGTYTVSGEGQGTFGTPDSFHFVYQPLSGDGTIIARVVSLSGPAPSQVGVMVRETLDPSVTNAFTFYYQNFIWLSERTTTGGSVTYQNAMNVTPPYWVKLVRSGTTFSGYASNDGATWTQVGTSQTISMAQSVYVGLAVTSRTSSVLAAATLDNVSVNSTAAPAPVITSVSATTGSIGSQVTINGSGFGASENGSLVTLNNSPVTINIWSGTSIVFTIPTGATTGYLVVSIAPSMNDSNAVFFTVTTQPLPTLWLDQDIGAVGTAGSATYANGAFTVTGAGLRTFGTSDGIHFVYQSLSGDGTIVARLASLQSGSSGPLAGVMIRETLDPASTFAFTMYYQNFTYLQERATTGVAATAQNGSNLTPPIWLKLVRSGNTFNGYTSTDGVYWSQIGTSDTINMAQNVYVGLAVSSGSTSAPVTATLDNVSVSSTAAPAPVITGVSATTGSIGSQVEVSGSGFGNSQNGGLVALNGVPVTINSWINTTILITIPSGATSGYLVASVAPSMNDSNPVFFAVTSQPLPTLWLDVDVSQVGVAGSGRFANGTFTVSGEGQGTFGTPDGFHFVYQPLSGDGTIVARVVSLSGPAASQAGVMIRETLNPSATNAFTFYYSNSFFLSERATTGGSASYQTGMSATPPYWVKLVRSGTTFSGYASYNGVTWTQVGTSQTISMAQTVYIGLAVTSRTSSVLATATFDNVSVNSTAVPAPVITSVSATTGSIGSLVAINGSGFGASQNGSLVLLNDAPVTINTWSNTTISITIPTGATSGYLAVSVAPIMNDSNAVFFTVTTQPLPTPWLDQDIGPVGTAGSATYSNGTFAVAGAGLRTWSTSDGIHFVYQPLSGDGTIVARLASLQAGSSGPLAGVMIRETLDPASTFAFTMYYQNFTYLQERATTGAASAYQSGSNLTPPIWLKLVRSGSTFNGYTSTDGVNWSQIGTSDTINMAQNVYVGLAVSSGDTTTPVTATFDNVSVTVGTTPLVTGLSPNLGTVNTSVTITGSSFGASQGTSTLNFNGALATSIASWTTTQIVALVPGTASSGTGPVTVTVNSIPSLSNLVFTVIHPVISSLSPPAAQIGGSITLTGTGFGSSQGTTAVQFNGVAATFISSWSDTSVTVTVPTNATNGPVTLTELGFPSNGVQFTVSSPLSITGISQSAGPVGTTITITGTGFGATQSNSAASFYGATATVNSWSDTQIVTTVPTLTSSGPVSVGVGSIWISGPWFTLTTTVQLTDSLGNPTTYVAEVVGGNWVPLSSQGSGCSSCTMRGTISNTYDAQGHVLSKTDELGQTTFYTYDSSGNVASLSVPIAPDTYATTTYTYNSFGEVLTSTDPTGNTTTNTYDASGNLLSVTTPAPNSSTPASVTHFVYDPKGQLTQITDPLNHVTTLTYYPTGLINTILDAQQNLTTYVYDAHGNRTSVTDAMSNQTTFAYDTGDRLKTITYPGTTGTTTFVYDYRGRRTSVTDQNGKTTAYAYDDADRLLTVTDAATPGNVTTYAYDTESNLTSIQDANGHTTSFTYDAFGRVSRANFPSSLSEYYYYDAVGNLITKTDRKNQTITYTYDQLNRLSQKLYPDSTAVNYTYDNDSRLTQVTDPTGTYQFAFDNMGRLTNTTASYAFLTGRNFTTGYGYDTASNRTSFTDPESGATSYVYDTLNRLQTLTPPAAFSGTGNFGFSYDALSRRTQMTRPNGLKSLYAYDNLSRLQSVLHQSGTTTLDGAAYTVDNAGNRTSRTPQPSGVASNYGYDAIYELTGVTQGSTTTESYTYDAVGNRLTSLGVSPYTNNTSNELTSIPGTTYTYDNNGNTQTKVVGSNTTTYAWDFENRMSSVTLPASGGTVSFKYDPLGRRIYKSSTSGTSVFAYDGNDLVEETNSSGAVAARYAQGEDIDEPLAMLRSSTTSYYHADGLGSITSLSNSAGSLAQTYTFDSFGRRTASSGSLTNPFQFTAREWDSETNLQFSRARYYDPASGRFLAEDPVRSPVQSNLYKYVRNSPPNRIDSSGMTDQPPYPPGMWGKYRGCKLVGTLALTLWTSEGGRTPTSDWQFVSSFQSGPDMDPLKIIGMPTAAITCLWERTYSAELLGHVLTTYTWHCWSSSCFGYNEFTTHTFQWSTKDLGRTTGKEPTTTHHNGFGVEDETNDVLCVSDPKLRP